MRNVPRFHVYKALRTGGSVQEGSSPVFGAWEGGRMGRDRSGAWRSVWGMTETFKSYAPVL